MNKPQVTYYPVGLVKVDYRPSFLEMITNTGAHISSASDFDLFVESQHEPQALVAESRIAFFPVTLQKGQVCLKTKLVKALCVEKRLMPVDPYALAALNKKDANFATTYPNMTQWLFRGSWYHIFFSNHAGELMVRWNLAKSMCFKPDGGRVWIAGIRQF